MAGAVQHGDGLAQGQGSGRRQPCEGIVTTRSSASPGCLQLLRLCAIKHSGCMAALYVATCCLAHFCMAALSMIAGVCPYMDPVCTLQGLIKGLQAAISSRQMHTAILRSSQACGLCNNGRCIQGSMHSLVSMIVSMIIHGLRLNLTQATNDSPRVQSRLCPEAEMSCTPCCSQRRHLQGILTQQGPIKQKGIERTPAVGQGKPAWVLAADKMSKLEGYHMKSI